MMILSSNRVSSVSCNHNALFCLVVIAMVCMFMSPRIEARGVVTVTPKCHNTRHESVKHNVAVHVDGVDLGSRGAWCNSGNRRREIWSKSRRVSGNKARIPLYGQQCTHLGYDVCLCVYVCLCVSVCVCAGIDECCIFFCCEPSRELVVLRVRLLTSISAKVIHASFVWFLASVEVVCLYLGLNVNA